MATRRTQKLVAMWWGLKEDRDNLPYYLPEIRTTILWHRHLQKNFFWQTTFHGGLSSQKKEAQCLDETWMATRTEQHGALLRFLDTWLTHVSPSTKSSLLHHNSLKKIPGKSFVAKSYRTQWNMLCSLRRTLMFLWYQVAPQLTKVSFFSCKRQYKMIQWWVFFSPKKSGLTLND